MKHQAVAFVFLHVLALLLPDAARADFFQISRPVYSTEIRDPPPYFPWGAKDLTSLRRQVADGKTIYASFYVIGGPDTLELLERRGQLGVFVNIFCDGSKSESRISIGIESSYWKRDAVGLRDEMRTKGYFDWRTGVAIFNKSHCSTIELVIIDDNSQNVGPPGTSGTFRSELNLRN